MATIQNLPFCSSLYASSCSRRDARASAERRVAVAQSWLKPAANVGFKGPVREREEGGMGGDRYVRKRRPVAVDQ